MFHCPNCNTDIPRWKSLLLTNFSTIRCKNCDAVLKPNVKVLSTIGGVTGFFGSLVGFIGMMLVNGLKMKLLFITIFFLMILAISGITIVRFTEFKQIHDS